MEDRDPREIAVTGVQTVQAPPDQYRFRRPKGQFMVSASRQRAAPRNQSVKRRADARRGRCGKGVEVQAAEEGMLATPGWAQIAHCRV